VVDETRSVDSAESEDVTNSEELEENKVFTADEIKKLQLEAKTYRKEKAALKKEFEETKSKLEALEAEKLSDIEKKEKKIAELEKELESRETAMKNKEMEALIVEAISDKNIVDKEVAKLLIRAELETADDVDSKSVSKVVDKLIKEKPYLVASTSANPSSGNFAKQENDVAPKDGVDVLKKFIGGYVK